MTYFNNNFNQLPPVTIHHVPISRIIRTTFRVHVHQLPARFNARLKQISHVSAVVPEPITRPIRHIFQLPRRPRCRTRRNSITFLTIHTSRVHFTSTATHRGHPCHQEIIFHVGPITRILTNTMRFQPHTFRGKYSLS